MAAASRLIKMWSIAILLTLAEMPMAAQQIARLSGVIKTGPLHMRYQRSSVARKTAQLRPIIVLLHGSSGIDSPNFPYREVTEGLVRDGFTVYVPQFEDLTNGTVHQPEAHYQTWVKGMQEFISQVSAKSDADPHRIVLIGYSLGGSIALAEASVDRRIVALVECSASLPDEYLTESLSLPPLLIVHNEDDPVMPTFNARHLQNLCELRSLSCESDVQPEGGHAYRGPVATRIALRIQAFLKHQLLESR